MSHVTHINHNLTCPFEEASLSSLSIEGLRFEDSWGLVQGLVADSLLLLQCVTVCCGVLQRQGLVRGFFDLYSRLKRSRSLPLTI